MRTFKTALLSAACLGGMASAAMAQDAGAPSTSATGGDIFVTAQRREQRLQDVPVSVSAISGDALKDHGVVNINDVIALTPGIQFQAPAGGAGFPVFNIRGVSLLDFSYTNEAAVAVYSDDVYLGNPSLATLQLFDIDRVEILRGPQGTLYGRNATGGLVSYISRAPTDTLSGNVMAQYGNYNDVVGEAAISGPVAENVRVRLAGRYQSNDGWQKNQATGTRLASVDHSIALRAIADMDITSNVKLTLTGTYSDIEGSEDGRAFFGTLDPSDPSRTCTPAEVYDSLCMSAAGFRDPDPDRKRPITEKAEIPYSLEAKGITARLEADLGFGLLTSITSYQTGRKTDGIDVDAAIVSPANLSVRYFADHDQFSQELRLGGESGPLTWLVGGYYYSDDRFFTAELSDLGVGNYSDQKIESLSGFSQLTYAVTDTVNVTAGGRYTSDKKTLDALALVAGPTPGTRDGTQLFLVSDKISPSEFNWRLGVDWHPTPDLMLFATAATGFKTGGWNTSLVTSLAAVGPVDNEKITTYEVGFKSQLMSNVTFNTTGYFSQYEKIQAAASIPCTDPSCLSPSIGTYLNIGDADIYGLESELGVRPRDDLSLNLGLALNENELDSPPGVAIAGTPLDGKKLANTPKVSVSGSAVWEPSLGDAGTLIFGADFKYQSKIFFRPDNTPYAVQPEYTIVNGRVGWRNNNGLQIEAYANNLFNKEYFISQTLLAGGIAPATWGKPRFFGVRASYEF